MKGDYIMAQNLKETYEGLLDNRFTQKSLTEQHVGKDYDWVDQNTIKVWTIGRVSLNDYNTGVGTSRYGTPTEFDDEINTYSLTQKKSFTNTVDLLINSEQGNIKKGNTLLKQIWDEEYVPTIDKYRLSVWANGAGLGDVNSTALTKGTIVEKLLKAHAAMSNQLVPQDGRVTFVTNTMAVETKLATELQYNEAYTGKSIINGQIGRMNGSPIVAVPDSYMPEGVEFMVKYKRATVDPIKLRKLNAHKDPPGIAGTLLEGVVRYDSFVLAQKVNGIYVYSTNGAVKPTFAKANGNITITSTGSAKIFYTTDGTNPKVSKTASEYTAAFTAPSAGTLIRAYATKSGAVNSAIGEYTV